MSQQNGPAILCVGRVYCDLVFSGIDKLPVLGEEIYAENFSMHAGGGAFITAAHLSNLGHVSSLSAYIQSGPIGHLLKSEFDRSNVDSSHCVIAEPSWGSQVTVAIAHRGDRAFLTKTGESAVPNQSEIVIALRRHKHLHIGELATLIECPHLIDWARSAGMTISLDCSWNEAAMADTRALELVAKTDLFLPNESELTFLLQEHQISSANALASKIGTCFLIEKRGPDGAVAHVKGKKIMAPVQAFEVVDATGAGDAFNAGFISNWLSGKAIIECLEAGNRKALDAISHYGGASDGNVRHKHKDSILAG